MEDVLNKRQRSHYPNPTKISQKIIDNILANSSNGQAGPSFLSAMNTERKQIDQFLQKHGINPEDENVNLRL